MYRLLDAIKFVFVVADPATGESINADALPTVALFKNGVVDGSVALTVTNLSPGVYLASGAIPVSGYSPFDSLALVASYLVGAVAMNKVQNDFVAAAKVLVDMTQAVPTSNTAQTVGDALNGARAQAFGKWTRVDNVLTIYASDGSTVVRTFVLDDADNPTSRA